jgi:hypothetical protein
METSNWRMETGCFVALENELRIAPFRLPSVNELWIQCHSPSDLGPLRLDVSVVSESCLHFGVVHLQLEETNSWAHFTEMFVMFLNVIERFQKLNIIEVTLKSNESTIEMFERAKDRRVGCKGQTSVIACGLIVEVHHIANASNFEPFVRLCRETNKFDDDCSFNSISL